MANHFALLTGIIHGKTIELQDEPGLPDGQKVLVTVRLAEQAQLPPGEGLRRAFGGWAGDDEEELDKYLEWNRQQRKMSRPQIDA
jgi:hypothetical protein